MEMLLTIDLKHNFVENSSLFVVASDLRNNLEHANLEHANLAQNIYFAISQLLVNES